MREVGHEIPDIHSGMEACFKRMRKNLEAQGALPPQPAEG